MCNNILGTDKRTKSDGLPSEWLSNFRIENGQKDKNDPNENIASWMSHSGKKAAESKV